MRADATAAWHAAVEAVDAQRAVARALEEFPEIARAGSDVLFVATGKAAVPMMRGVGRPARAIALIPHDASDEGLPVGVRLLRGAHPVPDHGGLSASKEILEQVRSLRGGQTLVYLVSGGTSSLFEVARPGISAEDVIDTYRLLLGCGAPIRDINAVRRALSQVKGGGLAVAAQPARVVTLALSDVGGEDPAVIGSGPTLAPARVPSSVREIARRYGLLARLPASVSDVLGEPVERAFPSDALCRVVCGIEDAVAGACQALSRRGYGILSREPFGLLGDAGRCAETVAAHVEGALSSGRRCALVWGGEVTVHLGESVGIGGRCRHMALRLAELLDSRGAFACAVAGTDGCDGSSDAAGAIIDGETAGRLRRAGCDAARALACFDSGPVLAAVGDTIVTGPTGTNVGDVLVVAVDSERERSEVLC